MATKANKTCVVCGNKYAFCPNCSSRTNEPAWKNIFCDANCKELYDICVAYRDGVITESEASIKLKGCNLNVLANATSSVSKILQNIKPDVKKFEKKEDIKVEVENVEEVKEVEEVKQTEVKDNKSFKVVNQKSSMVKNNDRKFYPREKKEEI